MNWKEFFKPTKGKILFSIIATVIRIILLSRGPRELCKCFLGGFEGCTDYYSFLILKNIIGCHCTCIPLNTVLIQYLTQILIPFAVSYIIYSLFNYLIIKFKPKK